MTASARLATATDLPILIELMAEFYGESAYSLDRRWAGDAFATLLAGPDLGMIWVLHDGSLAAGYTVLTFRFSMEHGGLEGCIDDLFVRSSSRRRGLARSGMDAMFAECKARNAVAMSVVVGKDSGEAKALYAGYGLEEVDASRQTLTARIDTAP